MSSFLQRFLSFDRLLGPVLVKIVYYFGAGVIVIAAGGMLLTGLLALAGGNFTVAIMQLIAVPAVAAVAFVYWRFLCELFMIAFLAYDRLGEVRNLLAGAPANEPDPNHPEF